MIKTCILVNLNSVPIATCQVPDEIAIVKLDNGFFYRTGMLTRKKPYVGMPIFLQSPVLLPSNPKPIISTPIKLN